MRIVSLIASATDIVTALGAADDLVGCSHECDPPARRETPPALTRPQFSTSVPSREIDTAVKSLVSDGLSVYAIDEELLRYLKPDVILTQDQCEVCAASLDDVEAAVCDWVGQDVTLVSLHPDTLADVIKDIHKIGDAIGHAERARSLTTDMQRRLDDLGSGKRPSSKVFLLEWIDPLMAAGHWIPELVHHSGAENLLSAAGGPSFYVSWEDIAAADPDIIVVAPCGFDLDRTASELNAVVNLPEWQTLRAVQTGQVALMDGNRYINRPSPAVVESAAMLHDIVHYGTPTSGPAAWRWLNGPPSG